MSNMFLLFRRLQTGLLQKIRVNTFSQKHNMREKPNFTGTFRFSQANCVEYLENWNLLIQTQRKRSGKIKITYRANFNTINLLSCNCSINIVLLFEIGSITISLLKQTLMNPGVNVLILQNCTVFYRCLYKNDKCMGFRTLLAFARIFSLCNLDQLD